MNDGIALLGRGEIKDKVTIKVAKASASAKEAIEKIGGQVIIGETNQKSAKAGKAE